MLEVKTEMNINTISNEASINGLYGPRIPEWQKVYPLATKCGLNTRLIHFHFKILHRYLITKRQLRNKNS